MTTTECTCLDSPNMLYGPCQHCEERAGNDYLTANKLAAISTALMSDTPVSMAASTLPEGHALDTAAYRDAIRAVKKIIELRNRVAELEARIPPAQAEPVPATTLPNWPPGAVADITAALDAEFERQVAEPVEAKEPWKPVVGQKVLVEAVVRTVWEDEYEGDTTIRVKWKDDTESWGIVSASQLRPLPVVQGGNLGNS